MFPPFCPVLLSVAGNGMVLLTYCCKGEIGNLEVPCINLALADIFCCIFVYPLSIASYLRHAWLWDSAFCTYYGFGRHVFSLCSMLTIAAISAIRYLRICHCSVYGEISNEWIWVAHRDLWVRYVQG